MGASIITAAGIAYFIQDQSWSAILQTALFGFMPEDAALAAIMSGGGILSMANVVGIICVSATYAGIFSQTGLLRPLQQLLSIIGAKTTPLGAICITSALTAMLSCNQTLAIMLTQQLCQPLVPKKEIMAIYLRRHYAPHSVGHCLFCRLIHRRCALDGRALGFVLVHRPFVELYSFITS